MESVPNIIFENQWVEKKKKRIISVSFLTPIDYEFYFIFLFFTQVKLHRLVLTISLTLVLIDRVVVVVVVDNFSLFQFVPLPILFTKLFLVKELPV